MGTKNLEQQNTLNEELNIKQTEPVTDEQQSQVTVNEVKENMPPQEVQVNQPDDDDIWAGAHYSQTETQNIGQRIVNWGKNFANTFVRGCKEVISFVSNPVRYVKAAKGKGIKTINNFFTPIEHDEQNVLEVKALKEYFPIKQGLLKRVVGYVRAVDGVSFNIKAGTTMGLVGESGCGKTTAGRTILRLIQQSGGEVLFNGVPINSLSKKDLRAFRPKMQIVFQDPYSSLSPRMPVGEIIGEAVRQHEIVPAEQYEDYISKIMRDCGLQEYHKNRYPHEFSGGQRQRICIARALALDPEFIVCDEPVSALDVSIQAQIINLLKDLQSKYKLTYLFISHDLSVVEHISDTVGVMYLGTMVEYSPTEKVFAKPLHPYTEALFSAIPVPDPDYKMNRIILEGNIPSPANPPKGCKFHTRCRDCKEVCRHLVPEILEVEPEHFVACHKFCSPDKYNDEFVYVEPKSVESLTIEMRAKIAEVKATLPKNAADLKAEELAELKERYNAKVKQAKKTAHRTADNLKVEAGLHKKQSEIDEVMYRYYVALGDKKSDAELASKRDSEIAQIKQKYEVISNDVKQKISELKEQTIDKLNQIKQKYQTKVEQTNQKYSEMSQEEVERLNNEKQLVASQIKQKIAQIKEEYQPQIKQLKKEQIDEYVKIYDENKVIAKARKVLDKYNSQLATAQTNLERYRNQLASVSDALQNNSGDEKLAERKDKLTQMVDDTANQITTLTQQVKDAEVEVQNCTAQAVTINNINKIHDQQASNQD